MNQTDETDQSDRPAFVMSYETVIQNSEDQDTYREETVTLTFTNPQGLSIPDSEWQCNADFLLCEYGIPGMAPNGNMSDWIASDCPMIENPRGENRAERAGQVLCQHPHRHPVHGDGRNRQRDGKGHAPDRPLEVRRKGREPTDPGHR